MPTSSTRVSKGVELLLSKALSAFSRFAMRRNPAYSRLNRFRATCIRELNSSPVGQGFGRAASRSSPKVFHRCPAFGVAATG